MPDIHSTSRNQGNSDIIVTIVAIIWTLYCMHFNTGRNIYLPFVAMLSFHPPVSLILILAGARSLIELSTGLWLTLTTLTSPL